MTTHTTYIIEGLGSFTSLPELAKALRTVGRTISSVDIISQKRTCEISYVHHHSFCEEVAA